MKLVAANLHCSDRQVNLRDYKNILTVIRVHDIMDHAILIISDVWIKPYLATIPPCGDLFRETPIYSRRCTHHHHVR